MSKVIIIGGGAAGMFAAVHAKGMKYIFLKRMRSLVKSYILPEREDAILPTPVMWRNFFRQ